MVISTMKSYHLNKINSMEQNTDIEPLPEDLFLESLITQHDKFLEENGFPKPIRDLTIQALLLAYSLGHAAAKTPPNDTQQKGTQWTP